MKIHVVHGRRQRGGRGHGLDKGARDVTLSWIFIHGTNIVDRGLNFCAFFFFFFVFFFAAPPPPPEEAK